MDGLVKFSDYDIFGYLASGLVGLWVYDVVFGVHVVTVDTWTITHAGLVLIAAYALGHGIAASATLIFDRLLVRQCLGLPTNNLLASNAARSSSPRSKSIFRNFRWKKWILSGYLEPLPAEVQKRVLDRAEIRTEDAGNGERAFYRAWPVIKRDPLPYARMESFLRLYGFCRNFSFVSFVAGIVFLIWPPSISSLAPGSRFPAWCALLSSIVMFHRYLKFFRAYSAEVFTTYAEPEPAKSKGHA